MTESTFVNKNNTKSNTASSDIVRSRLEALRSAMKQRGLDAYYVPTADYHLSEYTGDHFKFRSWLSGFTGSAGTLAVTADRAGLWTDGRYFLQAEDQLAGTGIDLYKMQQPGVPSIEEFFLSSLPEGSRVGVDGRTISAAAGEKMAESLKEKNIALIPDADLAGIIWTDRPALSAEKIRLYEEKYAGKSAFSKLEEIREEMRKHQADFHVITALDEIAWLFNLRGSDIAYNPVFLSYAVIGETQVHLFTDSRRIEGPALDSLKALGVILHPYEDIYLIAEDPDILQRESRILLSKASVNYRLYTLLKESGFDLIDKKDPAIYLKAVKNETEIHNTLKAHLRDGLIMTRFMKWLKNNVQSGDLTEAGAASCLDHLRLSAENNLGLSFETISGYGPHGAIVHYAVTAETDIPLEPRGLYLVDSGGHYLEGTTDITRTYALGPLTQEEKEHFALVLRCMLNLMYAVFPEGVCCHNLDVLARTPLWEHGLDFLHGTGHGVGHLLNVHEGPNSFYWKLREGAEPVPLAPGMITTDEPGVYITGKHGIRLENELLCREKESTTYGKFLHFEALTLAPIDLDAVDPALLTDLDRRRLNSYHRRVYETLSPYLTDEEQEWLKKYTREI